jgi:hypothetical protein
MQSHVRTGYNQSPRLPQAGPNVRRWGSVSRFASRFAAAKKGEILRTVGVRFHACATPAETQPGHTGAECISGRPNS